MESKKDGDNCLYKHFRLEDTDEGHLIFMDHRLVPPEACREELLNNLHQSHMSFDTLWGQAKDI